MLESVESTKSSESKVKKGFISGRQKVKIQQLPIGAIFTTACVFGGIFILLGVTFSSKFLALLCPVLLMIGYWGVVRKMNTGMPSSVIGDSYYYMGFIFTMFSLVISLLSLSNNDGVNINSIVGSFGAALLTTIVGLLLRLATTSFSIQTKEKRKNLESEIERSLLAFSAQLETLTSEVSVSLTKVHTETQKVLLDSADGYRKVQDELATTFKESMLKDQKMISTSMSELSKRISAIDVQPDVISSPIEEALSQLINSLNVQNETYKTITKDVVKTNKSLSTQLAKSGSFIQAHMENLNSGLESSLQVQLVSYENSVNQISTAILSSLGTFTDIKIEAEEQVQEQAVLLSSTLRGISQEIDSVRKPICNSIASINDGLNKFTINVDKLSESSNLINSSFEAVDKNNQALVEMHDSIGSLNVSVSTFNSQLASSVELNKLSSDALLVSANSARDKSDKMLADINNVYGELAVQIKELRDE
ncbi:hypothetical protein FLM48_16500 [Shewanella sp. Scap07]|uniref:hypothetical protein n=1 Tax=Shewanella sp. Scap07 TaxID=2589987 RepID=UPI0015B88B2C|nr:hypothetical protein [Shewanella sp. Scap07]QLE86523.1 hypothetical protein FLM48_16500 [Shewanella sp. Scap07]